MKRVTFSIDMWVDEECTVSDLSDLGNQAETVFLDSELSKRVSGYSFEYLGEDA